MSGWPQRTSLAAIAVVDCQAAGERCARAYPFRSSVHPVQYRDGLRGAVALQKGESVGEFGAMAGDSGVRDSHCVLGLVLARSLRVGPVVAR